MGEWGFEPRFACAYSNSLTSTPNSGTVTTFHPAVNGYIDDVLPIVPQWYDRFTMEVEEDEVLPFPDALDL